MFSQRCNYPSAFFVFLFNLLSPCTFPYVRLSWQALLILIHAQTTLTSRWVRCHRRSRWLPSLCQKMWSLYEILANQLSKASYLSGVQFILHVLCQCPGFTGIKEYRDNKGAQFDLLGKGDILFVPDGLQF